MVWPPPNVFRMSRRVVAVQLSVARGVLLDTVVSQLLAFSGERAKACWNGPTKRDSTPPPPRAGTIRLLAARERREEAAGVQHRDGFTLSVDRGEQALRYCSRRIRGEASAASTRSRSNIEAK